jgi:nucleotide-binding universal stress UspA family protein
MGRIVVGVDGSESSQRALRWAAREASMRGAPLEVVHVYETERVGPTFAYDETMDPELWQKAREDVEAAARRGAERAQRLVDTLVAELVAEVGEGVTAEGVAIEGARAAEVLIDRSRGAELLVVGSRGRGGFTSLLLGSVSQQCAHHAQCPVVIIRPTDDEDR